AVTVGHPERERLRRARARQLLADRLLDDDRLDDPLDLLGDLLGRTRLLLRRQRLPDLAVVAVERDRLQADAPRLDEEVLDVLDRHLLGHVDRLADAARKEGL